MTKTIFYEPSIPTVRPGIPNLEEKTEPASAKDRRCRLSIVPPLQNLNETSSNLLEYLVMLPSTHVHNLARCSTVWNAKTPVTQQSFPRCTIKFPALYRSERRFSYFFCTARFARRLLYPNARTK